MSPAAESRLDAEVADIRTSIESGDDAAAGAALTSLRTTVVELVGTNLITADRALRINRAIERLDAELAARSPATTTTVTTTTAPPPSTTAATVSTTSSTTSSTSTSTTAPELPPGQKKKDKDDDDD